MGVILDEAGDWMLDEAGAPILDETPQDQAVPPGSGAMLLGLL